VAGGKIRLARDFRDLLAVFVAHDVRFLVVGAYALAVLGRPRATGDLDVWIDATEENAKRALTALRDFGAPLRELRVEDLASPGTVFQIGLPPLRIDILTAIDGVEFSRAWPRRLIADFDGIDAGVIGREDFLANKRATGRLKDRADAERLDPRRRRRPRARR
jgi:hypothetical protein